MVKSQKQTVAIIGGGFCGLMTAIHLKQHSKQPIHVLIFDTENTLGCGVAYSTYTDLHLLNVRAGNMSAFPDDPLHFTNWTLQNFPEQFNEPEEVINSFLPQIGRAHV